MANSVHTPNTYTMAFPGENYTLICSKIAFCMLPISLHKCLKESVLKGRDLIKLIIFTASSSTFLSEGGVFILLFFTTSVQC